MNCKRCGLLIGLLLALGGTLSCEKNEIEDLEIDYGYAYFPLEIGHRWTYEADSVIFDPVPGGIRIDTISFQIRETITDTFSNNEGGLTYRILYEERKEGASWTPLYIFSAEREATRAIREENNFRLIPLVFPVKEKKSWEADALVNPRAIIRVAGEPIELFKGWQRSSILQRLDNYSIGGVEYKDVIEVELANNENELELRKVTAFYARDIGLIHYQMSILNTQCILQCQGLQWAEKAEEGFVLEKKMIAFE